MNTKEEKSIAKVQKVSSQTKSKRKFKDKLIIFMKNNKAAIFFALLLFIGFIWFSIKMHLSERNYNNEKTQIINQYESKIDSLQIKHLEFSTKVFSWSVRSELLRNNTENLNQLITVFVKESGVNLVQLINPNDKIILLSSDKKYEGNLYTGNLDLRIDDSVIKKEQDIVKLITPVMGFNNMIGVLVVELKIK